MPFLVNPDTGTVVSVQGELEQRYRARGWAEPKGRPAVKVAPAKPSGDVAEKPTTRRNARRSK